ncbi:DUF1861 family protein [Sporolactobacillus sp. THM7-4]|nr:DUF1861 family protein [Sporolactobacillus sp. THM7-4]
MMDRVTHCKVLLTRYEESRYPVHHVEKLTFQGVGNKDVYNITAPFFDEGKEIIAGRVESRDSEKSFVAFFEQAGDNWALMRDMPEFPLQDPFVTRIDGQLIFGGVDVSTDKAVRNTWRTVLYKGKTIQSLTPFFKGPIGMKDLRLGQMPNGTILVLTRPQGKKGGRGKIGFLLLSKLEELNIKMIEDAPLLEGHFAEGEWGGANEIHPLKNGNAGVLGHVAYFDGNGDRHYHSMIFTLDPLTGSHTPVEIIASRSDFLEGPSKRPDLKDIVFSGGAIRKNSRFILYAGTSDAEAQKIVLDDPFEKYEQRGVEDAISVSI